MYSLNKSTLPPIIAARGNSPIRIGVERSKLQFDFKKIAAEHGAWNTMHDFRLSGICCSAASGIALIEQDLLQCFLHRPVDPHQQRPFEQAQAHADIL